MQLESMGKLDEQLEQLDFQDAIRVTQDYIDTIGATDGDGNPITVGHIPPQLSWDASKDDYEIELENIDTIKTWIHLACKKLPSPPSLLVQLYRRLR